MFRSHVCRLRLPMKSMRIKSNPPRPRLTVQLQPQGMQRRRGCGATPTAPAFGVTYHGCKIVAENSSLNNTGEGLTLEGEC